MNNKQLEKILRKLKNIEKSLSGIERESTCYKIKKIEELLTSPADEYRISTTKIVARCRIVQKVEKESKIIDGYRKILKAEPRGANSIMDRYEFSKIKMMVLRKELEQTCNDNDGLIESFVKVSGSLTIDVLSFEIDPIYEAVRLDFFVDMERRGSLEFKPGLSTTLAFELNREFEMILYGLDNVVLGLVYLPCEFFINKQYSVFDFDFRNYNYVKMKINFKKDIKLIRNNAQIVCMYKQGHGLESIYIYSVRVCGVCNSFISVFTTVNKCFRCKFLCHKKCTDLIFFKCINSRDINVAKYKMSYNIKHDFTKSSTSGLRFCNHCGDRININECTIKCERCFLRFHASCEDYIFESCKLDLELRKKIVEFKPPITGINLADQKIKIEDFNLVKVLGRGSFGKVMLAFHKQTEEYVALKILKKERMCNVNDIGYIEIERKVLSLVTSYENPFLLKMNYCFQDRKNLYLGIEYLSGGDLFYHLSKKKFSEAQIKLYACEILMGLEFLHEKHVVYRDIKLDNILLAPDGHIKIVDFGLCKTNIGPLATTFTYCGTLDTIAPEIIKGDGYTKAVDWWSYGVVLYELYERRPPFAGATSDEITQNILNTEPECSDATPEDAKSLISSLLIKNPTKRLGYGEKGTSEVKLHKYFKDINWVEIYQKKTKPEFIPADGSNNFDQEFTDEPALLSSSSSFINFDKYFSNFK